MGNSIIDWLMDSDEPWTRYRTLVDLMDAPYDDGEVKKAREHMLAHPKVMSLLEQATAWPDPPIKRHNDAKIPVYALTTLADFGLRDTDPGVFSILDKIKSYISEDGAFRSLVDIPKAFGGSGDRQMTWILCDSTPLLYAMARLCDPQDATVIRALEHLVITITDIGWSCAAAQELGRFKGPGKRGDPCPIVNVWGLKALSIADKLDCDAAYAASEMLLSHYAIRGQKKYYLFGIGTDFHKLKYPFIWYDILHVTDTLTSVPYLTADSRLAEMLAAIRSQADEDGRYTATSMYMAWKGWSFANKREPSPWLTFLALRCFRRAFGAYSINPG